MTARMAPLPQSLKHTSYLRILQAELQAREEALQAAMRRGAAERHAWVWRLREGAFASRWLRCRVLPALLARPAGFAGWRPPARVPVEVPAAPVAAAPIATAPGPVGYFRSGLFPLLSRRPLCRLLPPRCVEFRKRATVGLLSRFRRLPWRSV